MKRTILLLTITFLFTLSIEAQKTKIACVGNSITYGAGVANREKNSYPMQLQYMLGDEYEVKNFGVSGTTLMSSGNSPYINTREYKSSMEYAPQIVLIKLGTNDAKTINKEKLPTDYKRHYQQLINTYKALPSHPRIILLKPVTCLVNDGSFINTNALYEQTIIPIIEQLAYENDIELLNLYNLFEKDIWVQHLMPDKLHPSSLGASEMAQYISTYLLCEKEEYVIPLPAEKEKFNFHGYTGYRLGKDLVVEPKFTAKGKPWVIRARFWGHQPQTDIALLENGFHITYCDVADLYGSPKATKRYDAFYKKMISKGLNKKVVLEGMSRGGLIVFNWAAQNQKKIAAIYADAPVLDIKSWPFGWGKGEGSPNDSKILCTVYGFKNEEEVRKWRSNPVDKIKKLKNIPIILVVGDEDKVVPIEENSTIFEKNIPNIEVIHKPTVGHHPHSLHNPKKIVEFILRNTGHLNNPCTKPTPGSEYREGAGWIKGSDWHTVANEIDQILSENNTKVLLLGNSIIQGFGSSKRKAITGSPGFKALDKYIISWENGGISGDCTQHLLWRLKNGNYAKSQPEKVFIAIGVNNLIRNYNANDIAEGIIEVANQSAKTFPNSQIILFGLLPINYEVDGNIVKGYNQIHKTLAKTTMPQNVKYHNLHSRFTDSDGTLQKNLFSGDNLHLSVEGYELFAKVISEF